jgi:3D (Asp-Asp-Asp) domain-containing protein
MTRYILSCLLMLLFVAASTATACAEINSKRPMAPAPTVLGDSIAHTSATAVRHAAHTASSAIAHAAKKSVALAGEQAMQAAVKMKHLAKAGGKALGNHLARLTAYWAGEGDYYTRHHISSTGIRLHQGHCAVDPTIIPYGSVVQIDGLGSYVAVDTGTAVVSRRAARESGHNRLERGALVIDLYFENRRDGERFAANGPKFASITWSQPGAATASNNTTDANPPSFAAAADEAPRSKAL